MIIMMRISSAVLLVSITLFEITWFGYAVQHGLISNMNGEILGMRGFEWHSSNNYNVNLFELLLIFIGFKLLKPIKT